MSQLATQTAPRFTRVNLKSIKPAPTIFELLEENAALNRGWGQIEQRMLDLEDKVTAARGPIEGVIIGPTPEYSLTINGETTSHPVRDLYTTRQEEIDRVGDAAVRKAATAALKKQREEAAAKVPAELLAQAQKARAEFERLEREADKNYRAIVSYKPKSKHEAAVLIRFVTNSRNSVAEDELRAVLRNTLRFIEAEG